LSGKIAFVGAGAVGGYTGGHIARAGHDVTLIDPWAEHVAAIKHGGLQLGGTQGEHTVRVNALHVGEVQSLAGSAVDIAFICMKLYDTAWATALIAPYLSPGGCVVTMQNGLVEDDVARIVGWGRTLGCIASTISVEAVAPGRIVRSQMPGGDAYTVFRVGELNGLATARAQQIAELLRCVDSAKVTSNLWGERWSKLTANTMTTACRRLPASISTRSSNCSRRAACRSASPRRPSGSATHWATSWRQYEACPRKSGSLRQRGMRRRSLKSNSACSKA
jgi:2-dehydropantoate 2-reductase